VANMCEGELILCFANIHFLCIFLRSLKCQNLCGVHKSSILYTGHTEDALIALYQRRNRNKNSYLFHVLLFLVVVNLFTMN
jgi:hypothetical protein